MKKEIYWKEIITPDGKRVEMHFKKYGKCREEFNSNNIFSSKYCEPCATDIKRAKTRERVRKHRQKEREIAEK